MSIWHRIRKALDDLRAGASLSEVFAAFTTPPEKTVGFAIAVIALGAKMAKADGRVTRDEVAAFREVFKIEKAEEKNAARIYNLARTDTVGFEAYAKRIASLFDPGSQTLIDLLESLFYIASADGHYHAEEDAFLREVARIFGVSEREYICIKSRFAVTHDGDPYAALGVSPDDELNAIRATWQKLVRENHPDQLIARGVPEEAIELANKRLARINTAWQEIKAQRSAA